MNTKVRTGIIIEFGSNSLGPVAGAVRKALGTRAFTVEVLPAPETDSLNYQESGASLEEAEGALESGDLTSVLVSPREPSVLSHAMIFAPEFHGDSGKWWHGQVEASAEYAESLLHCVCDVSGLLFASASVEESLDLASFNPEDETTFPWADWRLIAGAVLRDGQLGGDVGLRQGPAAARFGGEWLSGPTASHP